jgi:uncharacterized CHY-type Zn-finger protein
MIKFRKLTSKDFDKISICPKCNSHFEDNILQRIRRCPYCLYDLYEEIKLKQEDVPIYYLKSIKENNNDK